MYLVIEFFVLIAITHLWWQVKTWGWGGAHRLCQRGSQWKQSMGWCRKVTEIGWRVKREMGNGSFWRMIEFVLRTGSATHRKTFQSHVQTYASNKTQRFKSGFGFSIFWVWGFWVRVWVFCKSFANFELDYLKLKKI